MKTNKRTLRLPVIIFLTLISTGILFAQSQESIVYNTSNSGLPNEDVYAIAIDIAGNKWIGTDGGLAVYREGGVIIKVEEEKQNHPEDFVLYQNYPNPFNSLTKIRFMLKENGLVSVKLYDLMGREINTLINEFKEKGEYEIEFDASKYGLSSGVYFYQMRAGNYTSIKKMVYLK